MVSWATVGGHHFLEQLLDLGSCILSGSQTLGVLQPDQWKAFFQSETQPLHELYMFPKFAAHTALKVPFMQKAVLSGNAELIYISPDLMLHLLLITKTMLIRTYFPTILPYFFLACNDFYSLSEKEILGLLTRTIC